MRSPAPNMWHSKCLLVKVKDEADSELWCHLSLKEWSNVRSVRPLLTLQTANGKSFWIHFTSTCKHVYLKAKTHTKKKLKLILTLFLVSGIVSVLEHKKGSMLRKSPTQKFFLSQQQSPLFISVWIQPSLPEFQFLTQSLLWSLRVASLRGPYGEQPAIRVRKPVSGSELKPLQYLKAIFCLFGGFNP